MSFHALRDEIRAIELPEQVDQDQIVQFFKDVKSILEKETTTLPFELQNLVSYPNAKERDRWLEKNPDNEAYRLETCIEASKCKSPASKINYFICYSYPGPVFENTPEYRNLKAENGSEEEINHLRIQAKWGGLMWHAVVVKFHARKIYIYDSDYTYDSDAKYVSLNHFNRLATVKNLIKAFKSQGLKIEEAWITGEAKFGNYECQKSCFDFIQRDIVSYLTQKEIKKDDISKFCQELKWEKVYFS